MQTTCQTDRNTQDQCYKFLLECGEELANELYKNENVRVAVAACKTEQFQSPSWDCIRKIMSDVDSDTATVLGALLVFEKCSNITSLSDNSYDEL